MGTRQLSAIFPWSAVAQLPPSLCAERRGCTPLGCGPINNARHQQGAPRPIKAVAVLPQSKALRAILLRQAKLHQLQDPRLTWACLRLSNQEAPMSPERLPSAPFFASIDLCTGQGLVVARRILAFTSRYEHHAIIQQRCSVPITPRDHSACGGESSGGRII